jgi:hypothetical protein
MDEDKSSSDSDKSPQMSDAPRDAGEKENLTETECVDKGPNIADEASNTLEPPLNEQLDEGKSLWANFDCLCCFTLWFC